MMLKIHAYFPADPILVKRFVRCFSGCGELASAGEGLRPRQSPPVVGILRLALESQFRPGISSGRRKFTSLLQSCEVTLRFHRQY